MNTQITPKDFFMHLAATVALYAVAISLINLSFSSIDYAFPDVLAGYFSPRSIAWPTSMLLVLVPTLYVLEYIIHRDQEKSPEKKEIWIRRWRIYLTLFLTGVTILADLITLLNTYFAGEISPRFIYKVIVVLIVAGVIFAYYILERSLDRVKQIRQQRILGGVGVAMVLVAVVSGFVIIGSPAKQRAIRLDTERVNHLSSMQWQIVDYWRNKQQMPASLQDITDSISGYELPKDPVTRSNYEYGTNGTDSFQLCAIFDLPSTDESGRGGYYGRDGVTMSYPEPMYVEGNWKHEAGRVCFDRKIDPERYPPVKR